MPGVAQDLRHTYQDKRTVILAGDNGVTIAEHHSAEELKQLFREEKSARIAKRIWIVWQASLGRSEPEITADISLARRTVQQWVRRYNEEGLVGLQDRSGRGRKPPLSGRTTHFAIEGCNPQRQRGSAHRGDQLLCLPA